MMTSRVRRGVGGQAVDPQDGKRGTFCSGASGYWRSAVAKILKPGFAPETLCFACSLLGVFICSLLFSGCTTSGDHTALHALAGIFGHKIGTAPVQIRIVRNVRYLARGTGPVADLYIPPDWEKVSRHPSILVIHGGGWIAGDKADRRETEIASEFAAHGYVCLCINYTLAKKGGGKTWPENLHQCKAAVRWLRKNAGRLRIDPERIGAIGGSAGGHLATMLGVTRPEDGLDPVGPYGEFSSRVQAVVDLYGPIDLLGWQDLLMIGASRAQAPGLYRQASPLTYLRRDQPPILVIHGTADKIVNVSQSREFAQELRECGAPHRLIIIPHAVHSFDLHPAQRDLRRLVAGFFDHAMPARPVCPSTQPHSLAGG